MPGFNIRIWYKALGSPGGAAVKNPPANRTCRIHLWVGKIPWRRKWPSTPVFLPGKFHGQRSLAGYSPWGRKELDLTERLSTQSTHTTPLPPLSCRSASVFWGRARVRVQKWGTGPHMSMHISSTAKRHDVWQHTCTWLRKYVEYIAWWWSFSC